jgi:hypothetical protein
MAIVDELDQEGRVAGCHAKYEYTNRRASVSHPEYCNST